MNQTALNTGSYSCSCLFFCDQLLVARKPSKFNQIEHFPSLAYVILYIDGSMEFIINKFQCLIFRSFVLLLYDKTG